MPSVANSTDGTPMQQSSAESLEQVVEGDPRKQLELSVIQYKLGEWKDEFKMSSFTAAILNLLFTQSGARGQDSKFSDIHWTWIRRLECRQVVS